MYSKTGERRYGLMQRLGIVAAMAMVAVITLFGSGMQGVQAAPGNGTIQFRTAGSTVTEGDHVCISIDRSNGFVGDQQASYTVTYGAGAAFTNFSATLGYASFLGSQPTTTIDGGGKGSCLTTVDDNISNAARTITFQLTGTNNGAVIGTNATYTLTVLDNDGAPTYSFTQAAYSYNEAAGTVHILVIRSGATGGTDIVSCNAAGGGGAVSPGDYTFSTQNITFNPGDVGSKSCNLTLVSDAVMDPGKSVALTLTKVSGFRGNAGTYPTTIVNIIDNNGAGTVSFSNVSPTVVEGTTANVPVVRTGGSTGIISATCTVSDGTATASSGDYSAVSPQTLTWGNNDTSTKYCSVSALADSVAEGSEYLYLTLAGSYVGAAAQATLTILDNSGLGTVQFASATYVGYEGSGAAVIGLTRTGSSVGQVTVSCQTLDNGTATAGVDYTAGSYLAVFGAGQTTATCSIPITNDGFPEPLGETVTLGLTGISAGANYGFQQLATLTILDGTGTGVTVTGLSPNYGPSAGGNTVTITGTNFINATSVTFGGFSAGISYNNGSQITVTAPAHFAATVEVVVNTPQGSNSIVGTANDYTYTDGPTVTNVTPDTGPASGVPTTFVTITGTNFIVGGAGMTVSFGGTATTNFNVTDMNTIFVIAPPHRAGTVDIVVTTPGGSSPISVNDQFTYTGSSAPVVSGISPSSGATGITVTITGSGFTGVICPAGVTFGGVAATSCTVNSDTSITAVVPANAPSGISDVRVTNAIGTSANTTADNFNNTSSSGPTITYNLVSRFTLIGWSGINNISTAAALKGLESPDDPRTNDVYGVVTVIWRFDSASQSFKGYFPGSENVPGANDFTTLQKSVGYFVAINVGSVNWTVLEG